MSRQVSWRDRYPEGHVTCVRCLEVKDVIELDRMLWCLACRVRARERASWYGWIGGLAFALVMAVWVWVVIRPSDLIVGAWLATFAAAVWIGSKVSRELVYGAMRFQNAQAVEARPPTLPVEERADGDERPAAGGDADVRPIDPSRRPPDGPGAA